MHYFVLLLGLLLAGCQTAAETAPLEVLTPHQLSSPQKDALFDGVRSSLKDPGSAQFGDYVAGLNSKNGIVVCGWVNAKNSYGGYTGKQPYLALYLPDNGKFYVQKIGSAPAEQTAVLSVCSRMGLTLNTL